MAAVSAVCAAILALAWAAAPAQAVTQTFTYTGAEQTFVVPVGVSKLQVVVIGGSGGASEGSAGAADQVSATLDVTPGQTLYVEVGGRGENGAGGGAGGFNGGGNGGAGGGPVAAGGGGASDIRTAPRSGGLSPDTRLVVAGGGGGGGGTGPETGAGAGGAAGSVGGTSLGGNGGGGAGTAIAGGLGGAGVSENGGEGQLGSGGGGGSSCGEGGGGGGGGGGFYGGGGGGPGCVSTAGGGGGGGSSLVPAGGSHLLASLATAPQVQVTYSVLPPAISIASPADDATFTQGQSVTAIYSCTASAGVSITTCAGPVANGAGLDTATLGHHTFTVDAKDTDGGAATKSVSYTVVPPPPPSPVAAPPSPPLALTAVGQTAKTWREGNALPQISKKAKGLPVGTIFSFTLNKKANVELAFTGKSAGRKVKGKCQPPSPKAKGKPHCPRPAGSLTFDGHEGVNQVRFAGRITAGSKLPPGHYTLQITATDAEGKRTAPQSLGFTIVK